MDVLSRVSCCQTFNNPVAWFDVDGLSKIPGLSKLDLGLAFGLGVLCGPNCFVNSASLSSAEFSSTFS